MNKNRENNNIKDAQLNLEQGRHFENQREQDQCNEPRDGFAYIGTAGWIDRLEKRRRRGDPFYF